MTIEHIVFFKMEEQSAERFVELKAAAQTLKAISGVLEVSFGKNFSEKSQGYNYGLRILFKDKESLDAFWSHEIHLKYISTVKPLLIGGLPTIVDWVVDDALYFILVFASEIAASRVKKEMRAAQRVGIVTGANTGIGKEITEGLLEEGFKVIMACRDLDKCNDTATELRQHTSKGEIECMKLDLASFQSIREFATNFKQRNYPLHVLVNNAGVYKPPLMRTVEGHELQFGVNHLGHFLLTNLLLDVMKQTFPISSSSSSPSSSSSSSSPSLGRIVTLSSRAHSRGTIDFDDYDSKKSYSADKSYAQSKLANLLFAYELNKRLQAQGYPIISNAVHPGIVYSEMYRHYSWPVQWAIYPIALLFYSTPKQGAATPLYLATSTEATEDVSKRLWELSAKLCGIDPL